MNRAKLFSKITEKWTVKVLSLAAAVIISIFYRMNSLETRYFTVPLSIEASDAFLPANSFPMSVKISIRGESENIQPVLAEDIEAFIDLKRYANEGRYRVPVQIRKKGTALGVEPMEVSVLPVEIPLLLEQRMTRNVNVFPVLRGTAAEGYDLTGISLSPASVNAEGPRSIFDSRIEFNTEPIDIDRRYEDFSGMISIKKDNPLLYIKGNAILEFHGTISRITRKEQENNASQTSEGDLSGGEQ